MDRLNIGSNSTTPYSSLGSEPSSPVSFKPSSPIAKNWFRSRSTKIFASENKTENKESKTFLPIEKSFKNLNIKDVSEKESSEPPPRGSNIPNFSEFVFGTKSA